MCFWSVKIIQDKLELDDGAAGGRETNKTGDENGEEVEFELESEEVSRKCETPVSLLYFVQEADIAMQKFGLLLDLSLLFRIRCSQFSISKNVIFDESAMLEHVSDIFASFSWFE